VKVQREIVERPDLAPVAPAVGPFPRRAFLRTWLDALGGEVEPLTIDWDRGQLSLMRTPAGIEMMGEPDLTDYHSPLGSSGFEGAIALLLEEVGTSVELNLDSLPIEAADPLQAALTRAGLHSEKTIHETAMVLRLSRDVDEFYRSLSKRDRHELRRKRRRYESLIGPVEHVSGGRFGFEEFVRLHRMASGDKGQFMNGDRLAFFSALFEQPDWRVDYLVTPAGKAAACLFGWFDEQGYYLYNSSYDPSLQSASPGLVVLQSMIEKSIDLGLEIFDFLKGDEDYKARLGADPRPLYRLAVRT
jgi:CelD/BcsL family acetyltransferase involved in cellulose biosynthesis